MIHNTVRILALLFLLTCFNGFAEDDCGKFFPHLTELKISNLYLELYGGGSLPLHFTGKQSGAMTSFGGAFGGAIGYNFGGWLVGIDYNHNFWGQGTSWGALMENFHNNLILFKVRRVLSKTSMDWLPTWLEIVPGLAGGVDFITTDYYKSVRKKEEGKVTSIRFGDEGATCLFGKALIETSFYFGNDYLIPYLGGDFNIFYDTSIGGGMGHFFTFYMGIRSYPLGLFHKNRFREKPVKVEPEPEPEEILPMSVSIMPAMYEGFTPDGDGLNDTETFFLGINHNTRATESWKVDIFDPKGNHFRTLSGNGKMPDSVVWDGLSDNGNEHVVSMNLYKAVLTAVPAERDRTRTEQEVLTAETEIKTGLLIEEIIPNKKWKMVVNTIHFDPNRATFRRISEEQRQENIKTIKMIADQIKAHPGCAITVEGYANNTSNTERENIQDLIPLSRERARAIYNLLTEQGITGDSMTTRGMGGANPIAAWRDTENWWKNRRVEFILEKY